MPQPLSPPPDEHLDTARLRYLLGRCEFPVANLDASWMAELLDLLDNVQEHRDGIRTWWSVGGVRVWAVRFGVPDKSWAYACDEQRVGLVPHVGAVVLCRLWGDPDWRSHFERPLWWLELGPLVDAAARPEVQPSHEGRVVYVVQPGEGGHAPLRVEREVQRRNKRGSGWLKPRSAPSSLQALQALVPLSSADEALHEALGHLQGLEKKAQSEWQGTQVLDGARGFVARELLRTLSRCAHVRMGEEPVRVQVAVVRPRLAARPVGDDLQLEWSPALVEAWSDGVVLTADGVLAPLASDFPADLVPSLVRPLPRVPAKEADGFVRAAVVESGLDVELDRSLAGVVDPDARHARVVLEEDDDGLRVRLVVRYQVGRELVEVDAGRGRAVVEDATLGLVRRDWPWERARVALFAEVAGAVPPMVLQDEAALDFLAERLPRLRDTWDVFGERGLTEHGLRGRLEAVVERAGGTDFGLRVRFEDEVGEVAVAPVLRSWLAGRRYHRLEDGQVVALPEHWLARHGPDALALEEAAAAGASSSALAWIARDLLDDDDVQELVRRLRSPGSPRVPGGLLAELRPYQQSGLAWLQALDREGLGGVLADDMGLGKTLQTLCFLASVEGPCLVVAPTSVLHGWCDQAARFLPELRVQRYHGPGRRLDASADVVVTSYALLRLDAAELAEVTWRSVVLDEAQAIKNPDSQVARAARQLRATSRFALSGTPVENRLLELWSLMSWVVPGVLGSRASFIERVAGPIERDGSSAALLALRSRVRPFLLRRLKSDVLGELPEKTEVVVRVELSEVERALYDRVRDTYRASVQQRLEERGMGATRLHILEALTRLRQASCHPALLPFDEVPPDAPSAKLDRLDALLDEAIADGHRTLVFSQWPSLLRRVRSRLEQQGIEVAWLDGTTRDRGAEVARFQQASGPPVFLVSLKAGGTGLTLTAADHVVLLDPWWNPAVEDQATDRAHRIGQTRPVLVHRLVAADTVEEQMLAIQERKRALVEAAIEGGELAGVGDEAAQVALDVLGLSSA